MERLEFILQVRKEENVDDVSISPNRNWCYHFLCALVRAIPRPEVYLGFHLSQRRL